MAEILDYGKSEGKEVAALSAELLQFKFDDNDRSSKDQLKAYYDELVGVTLTIDQQVMLMARWYHQREFSGYLIGWQLSLREKKIIDDVRAWDEKKSQVPPEFLHLNEFFQRYEDVLPFKKSAMYDFKKIYETESLDSFLKFGFSKITYLMRVKDEDVASKLRKEIEKKPDLTLREIKQKEEDWTRKATERRKEVRADEYDEVRIKFAYDVKESAGKIVLVPGKNVTSRDLYNALAYFEKGIKNYLAKVKRQ